jgi:branched-chain amino acid transport system substrate-binding protein
MAIDEINGAGGVLGKKLEVVSRDDGANRPWSIRITSTDSPPPPPSRS